LSVPALEAGRRLHDSSTAPPLPRSQA